jgi:hypothetical protein
VIRLGCSGELCGNVISLDLPAGASVGDQIDVEMEFRARGGKTVARRRAMAQVKADPPEPSDCMPTCLIAQVKLGAV